MFSSEMAAVRVCGPSGRWINKQGDTHDSDYTYPNRLSNTSYSHLSGCYPDHHLKITSITDKPIEEREVRTLEN